MRFQRKNISEKEVYESELEPRSLYIITGKARYSWQHSIPATKNKRYSITFRTLKENNTA